MHDTEPMPTVEPPRPERTLAHAPFRVPPAATFVAGALAGLFIACVWLHVELSGLRADVRAAHQAVANAQFAADRLAADARRVQSESSSDPSAADSSTEQSPTASEDTTGQPARELPEESRNDAAAHE